MVQLMPLHPKTLSSLASFKSRLVLPFWHRLTQAVLEKRPLNGCSSTSSNSSTHRRNKSLQRLPNFFLINAFVIFVNVYYYSKRRMKCRKSFVPSVLSSDSDV